MNPDRVWGPTYPIMTNPWYFAAVPRYWDHAPTNWIREKP